MPAHRRKHLELHDGDFSLGVAKINTPDREGTLVGVLGHCRSRFSIDENVEGWFDMTSLPDKFHLRVLDGASEASAAKADILDGTLVLKQETKALWTSSMQTSGSVAIKAVWGVWLGADPDTTLPPDAVWAKTNEGGATVFQMFGPDWRSSLDLQFERVDAGMNDAARLTYVQDALADFGSPLVHVREVWL